MSTPTRPATALDWLLAVAVLVVLPVWTGAIFHRLYGDLPGLVMFAGMAGVGAFFVLVRMLRSREVRD